MKIQELKQSLLRFNAIQINIFSYESYLSIIRLRQGMPKNIFFCEASTKIFKADADTSQICELRLSLLIECSKVSFLRVIM